MLRIKFKNQISKIKIMVSLFDDYYMNSLCASNTFILHFGFCILILTRSVIMVGERSYRGEAGA